MKTLKLWGPAIFFGLIAAAAKICDTWFNVNGSGFFLSSEICSIIFVAVLFLLFVIAKIISSADRKSTVTGKPERSVFSGLFGFVASVGLFGSGIITMMSMGSSENLTGNVFMCFSSLLAGVVLLYESCISFTGQNGMKHHPLMTLLVPLWAGVRLVLLFVEYSVVSIQSTEMFDILSVALLMMFLYYQAAYFAEINPQTSIRRMTQYGILFFICSIIITADIIIKMIFPAPMTAGVDSLVVQPTVSRILTCVMDIAFCGYALFLTRSACKKAVVLEAEDEEEDEATEFLGSLISDKDENDKDTAPAKASSGKEKKASVSEKVTEAPIKTEPKKQKEQQPKKQESVSKTVPAMPVKEVKPAEPEPKAVQPQPVVQTAVKTTPVIKPDTYSAEDMGLPSSPVKTEEKPAAPKSDDEYDELFKMLDAMSSDD